MPVTSYITQQGGVFEKIVDTLVNTIGFIGTAGAQTTIAPGRSIPALGALYLFLTYAMTGAVAVGARASATPKGHDNNRKSSEQYLVVHKKPLLTLAQTPEPLSTI